MLSQFQVNLFLLLSFCFLTVAKAENNRMEAFLERSYQSHSDNNFQIAIDYADSAQQECLANRDTSCATRAEFYTEISRQIAEGNNYDINKIETFKSEFSRNGFWLEAARANIHLSVIYNFYGDVKQELKNYMEALSIYENHDYKTGIAGTYSDISLMYYDQHDYDLAFQYIRKAIAIDEVFGTPKKMHRDLNNLAIIFEHTGPLDSAIYYQQLALEYAITSKDAFSIGLSLSNLGNDYAMLGDYAMAELMLNKALKIRDSLGNHRGLSYTHNRLANLYIQQNKLQKASYHAQQSLQNALITGELKVKRMAYNRLEEIAAKQGNTADELFFFRKAVELNDSLRNSDNTKEITKMVLSYEHNKNMFVDSVKAYQHEADTKAIYERKILEQHNQRNISLASGLFFLIFALGAYFRARYIKKSKVVLQKAKDRSDELLLNILPSDVADELKINGKSEARNFENVTVLFTDFKGFTQTAASLTAKDLVDELNECFKMFDEIASKHGVEKIKTIGDAYMAAGGLHKQGVNSAKDVVKCALEMQHFMLERRAVRKSQNLASFEMRVGIHTGPVVAGIVGVKKFQYDIWGDTVNTASRMESNGKVGKVNISYTTYLLLKSDPGLIFESRGKIEVKGKGEMEMFFVNVNKPRHY